MYTYQVVQCPSCDGLGLTKRFIICPNNGKRFRKGCPKCGSTFKDHSTVDWKMVECYRCKGTKTIKEDCCSYVPKSLLETIPLKIYRDGHETTWNEANIGHNLALSVIDYGSSAKLTDEELLKDVKKSLISTQYTKIGEEIDQDSIQLCNHLGIFVGSLGYNVRKVMT